MEINKLTQNTNIMEKAIVIVDWDRNYCASTKNEEIACIATGRSLEELKANFERSIDLHLRGMREDGETIPEEFAEGYELVYVLSGKALMHFVDQLVTRKALSHETGINIQQLSHYAKGRSNPRPKMQEKIICGVRRIGQKLLEIPS